MRARFLENIPKLYAIRLFFWMHFFAAVLVPFYTQWGHLTLTQVLLLNAWFMFWNFLLEVPTGTVADFLGRKHSLALGSAIGVIAAIIYTSAPHLTVFLIAEVLFAAAYTLHSGADEALAYDSLLAEGHEARSKRVLARMESFKLGGIVIATLSGGWIAATWGLPSSLRAYAVPAALAMLLALSLREPEMHQRAARLPYRTILREGGRFFVQHRILLTLTIEAALTNALAWGLIWLFQPLLLRAGLPVAWLGVIHAATCLGQIAILSNLERVESWLGGKRRLLLTGGMLCGLALGALGFVRSVPLVAGFIVMGFSFGLTRMPIFSSYMNKYIPSDKRATVLSFSSMCRTFAIVVMNPLIGLLADRSLNMTMWALGGGMLILTGLSRIDEEHLHD